MAHSYHDEDLPEVMFTPLDAPFSPYSSGFGSSHSVSDSSTYIMSPEREESGDGEHHLHPIPEADTHKDGEDQGEVVDDELEGFIDILDDTGDDGNFDTCFDLYTDDLANVAPEGPHAPSKLNAQLLPAAMTAQHSRQQLPPPMHDDMMGDRRYAGSEHYQQEMGHEFMYDDPSLLDPSSLGPSYPMSNGGTPPFDEQSFGHAMEARGEPDAYSNGRAMHHELGPSARAEDQQVFNRDLSIAQIGENKDSGPLPYDPLADPGALDGFSGMGMYDLSGLAETSIKHEYSPALFPGAEAAPPAGAEQITRGANGYALHIITRFHAKYWRNDRKNLQCFPVCPEFGDYYLLRVRQLKHKVSGGGTCSSSVSARLEGPGLGDSGEPDVIALSRINLAHETGRSTTLEPGMELSKADFDALRKHCLTGKASPAAPGVVNINFGANSWKLTVELSKKRRPKGMPEKAPKYCFEVICLAKRSDGTYGVLCNTESTLFHIASTRTLAREIEARTSGSETGSVEPKRKRAAEEGSASPHAHDEYLVEGADDSLYTPTQVKRVRPDDPNYRAAVPDPARSHVILEVEDVDKVPESDSNSNPETRNLSAASGTASAAAKPQVPLAPPPPPPPPTPPVKGLVEEPPLDELESSTGAALRAPVAAPRVADTLATQHHESDYSAALPLDPGGPATGSGGTAGEVEMGPIPALVVDEHIPQAEVYRVSTAYQYCLFLGLFGGHHFYLGRHGWGTVYALTLGLVGVGWIYDLVRLRQLVDRVNRHEVVDCTLGEAYALWGVLGFVGAHRYALGDLWWGLYYTFTLGSLGVGWLVDAFRLPDLYEQSLENAELRPPREQYNVVDAYLLWWPGGIIGLHRLYLGDKRMFFLYLISLGGFGFAWLFDGYYLKEMVDAKRNEALAGGAGHVELQRRRGSADDTDLEQPGDNGQQAVEQTPEPGARGGLPRTTVSVPV